MTEHADTESGFPTKGSLKRIPFPQLIRQIARAEVTGSLYLLNGQTKKVIFFRAGKPVSVRSNVISECLGQILASEGLITQEQSDNSLEAVRRTGKKQGELLIEMGLISEGNLQYGLDAQFRGKLGDIFSWEEGRFQFKPGGDDTGEAPPSECNENIIISAIQSRYSDDRARHALRPFAGKYPVAVPAWTSNADPLELIPEEVYVLQGLDGSRSVDELLSGELDLPVPRTATLLYGLIAAGVVDLKTRRLLARPKPKKPELQPEGLDDADLAPDFEPASVIGEYEDTPLPSRLPSAAQSTSRMPALLTEDEEMFAGVAALDEDESVVLDTRDLRAKVRRAEKLSQAQTQGDESDFSDLDEEPAIREEPTTLDGSLLDLDEESFDDEVELLDDEEMVEMVDEVEMVEDLPDLEDLPVEDLDLGDIDDLPDLDDLDLSDIDDLALPEPEPEPEPEPAPAAPSPEDSIEAIPIDELSALEEVDAIDLDDLSGIDELPDLADVDDDIAEVSTLDEFDEVSMIEEVVEDVEVDDIDLDDIDLGDIGDDIDDLNEELGDLDDNIDLGDLDDIDLDDIDLGEVDLGDVDLGDVDLDDKGISDDDLDDLANLDFDDLAVDEESGDIGGARYQDAVAAMNEGDYASASALFEDAYQNGYDVAVLHAALAFSRYRAAGGNPAAAQDALDLLAYAEQREPELDLVHAYRGAVLLGLGATDSARESFERAIEINPYCEIAIQYINNM